MKAPPATVCRALLDPAAVGTWMVPSGMTSRVHELEPRQGGRSRISLTYAEPDAKGKTSAHTDTYHGRFVKLITNRRVVETLDFETADPAMRGEMTDNEAGWRSSLGKLAALVEGQRPQPRS